MYKINNLKKYNLLEIDLTIALTAETEIKENFYEIINFKDQQIGLLLGDLHQKKIPEEFRLPLIQGALKTLMKINGHYPLKFMEQARNIIQNDFHYIENISLFYSKLDLHKKELTFINSGLIYPILIRNNQARYLRFGEKFNSESDQKFRQVIVKLRENDSFLIFTDGLLTVKNKNKMNLGLNNTLKILADEPQNLINNLENFLNNFYDEANEKNFFSLALINVK